MAQPSTGTPELNAYVADSLLKKNRSYEELKVLLRDCRRAVEQDPGSEEAVAQLGTLIGALTANVSAIDARKHEAIVSEVLGIKLWGAPPEILSAILDFTRNLVLANNAFTHTCLQLIVYNFTPPPGSPLGADASQDPHGPWRPSEQALAVHQPLLAVLSRVLGLVPTAATNMLPLIVAQMPFKLRDRNTQCLYLSALFRIAEDRSGAPIKEALLTAVVEHLLSLDIEIKWEDIVDVPTGEEEEEEQQEAQEDVFELEAMLANELDINAGPEELAERQAMLALRQGAGGDGRGGWEGAGAGAHAAGAAAAAAQQQQTPASRPPVDEMANKMDSMMELVFEHLTKRIEAGELRQVWDTLLSAFDRTILNTHRSKFTQFLLFFACTKSPAHGTSLVRLLLTRLRDARHPAITRAACAAYLASFVARAAFLPEPTVVKALQELAAFCGQYCRIHGSSLAGSRSAGSIAAAGQAGSSMADALPFSGLAELGDSTIDLTQRHQVFYAAVQGVLYVLCYHMQPLVGEHQHQQPQTQQRQGAGRGDGAAGTVAQPGAGAGGGRGDDQQRRQLAEAVIALVRGPVWEVINHRLHPLEVCLPSVVAEFAHQASSLGIVDCKPLLKPRETQTRSQRPLEMFFPFDPYLLRRSSRFLKLKESYVRWRHGHPQAAAGGGGAGTEAAESDEDEGEEGVVEASDGQDSSSEERDEHDVSDEEGSESSDDDEELADPSLPSDGMLHDPTARLNAAAGKHHHHHHRGATGIHGGLHAGHHHHHRAHPQNMARSIAMGTSYMSYASVETASQGDGTMSPYGMSPHDAGDMLERNPLGASPGAVPMSLGTPEALYMSQVPVRIGRQ